MQAHGGELDHVMIMRPQIAEDAIRDVTSGTSAILTYYGVDIHFMRMQRQFNVTGDPTLLRDATLMERTERRVWRHFDLVIYPSEEEAAVVRALSPETVVRAIVPFCFDGLPIRAKPPKGHTLLFVAGFSHTPNADAAQFLAREVLPLLQRKLPDARVVLAGSNPTEAVQALAGPAVSVTGYVSEEELRRLYDTCRAAIVPLRFGAGVKGKVVEALSRGLPLVTTSVGAQGIEGLEALIPVRDTAPGLVEALTPLLTDDGAWNAQSHAQTEFARWRFSPSAMRASVLAALEAGEAASRSDLAIPRATRLVGPEREPPFSVTRLATLADYERHAKSMQNVYHKRQALELGLVSGPEFDVPGFCAVCGTSSAFHVDFAYAGAPDEGPMLPNWRERLSCPRCTLNSRSRAALHFLSTKLGLTRTSHIYLTEQLTPLFANISRLYPNSVGSEVPARHATARVPRRAWRAQRRHDPPHLCRRNVRRDPFV